MNNLYQGGTFIWWSFRSRFCSFFWLV